MLRFVFVNLTGKQLASALKALGDPLRLRAARLLADRNERELCNCEFVDALEESQPNVSRCLKALSAAGLVTERREGKWVYYRLAADHAVVVGLREVLACLKDEVYRADDRRLRDRLRLRRKGRCVLGVQKTHLLSACA